MQELKSTTLLSLLMALSTLMMELLPQRVPPSRITLYSLCVTSFSYITFSMNMSSSTRPWSKHYSLTSVSTYLSAAVGTNTPGKMSYIYYIYIIRYIH
jgi:hypothetical protein